MNYWKSRYPAQRRWSDLSHIQIDLGPGDIRPLQGQILFRGHTDILARRDLRPFDRNRFITLNCDIPPGCDHTTHMVGAPDGFRGFLLPWNNATYSKGASPTGRRRLCGGSMPGI